MLREFYYFSAKHEGENRSHSNHSAAVALSPGPRKIGTPQR